MSYRAFLALVIALLAVPAFGAEPAASEKEVAIVRFSSNLEQAKLEGTTKSIRLDPYIGYGEDTPFIRLVNEILTPREITLRILDLTQPEYDVYTDGHFTGTMKKEALESGIPVSFQGTFVTPDYREYYSRLRERGREGAERYPSENDEEAGVCRAVLQGIAGWVDGVDMGDLSARTARILIVPAGQSVARIVAPPGEYPQIVMAPPRQDLTLLGPSFDDAPMNFSESVRRLGDEVQNGRRDVAKLVRNVLYRYDTLAAITPIDFSLILDGKLEPGKKVTVRALLKNWTDRAVSGNVELTVPAEWNAGELSSAVQVPAFSEAPEIKFEVTVPDSAGPHSTVSATAELMIEDVQVKLHASAE